MSPEFWNFQKFGWIWVKMWHKRHIVSQLWFENEFYKSLTMKNCWFWVTFWGTIHILGYKSFRSIIFDPSVTWSDYCAISYTYCAICYLLFLAQKSMSRKFYFLEKVIYHHFMQFTLCSLLFKVTWPNHYQIWK